LNPAFATEHIKNLVPTFWSKACELRQLWEDEAVHSDKRGYDVMKALTRTTLDIIGLAGTSPLLLTFVATDFDD